MMLINDVDKVAGPSSVLLLVFWSGTGVGVEGILFSSALQKFLLCLALFS